MSQYRPAIEDLLRSVRELLTGIAAECSGERRYKLQVASYLLGICERQLTIGQDHPEADRAAWTDLLGREADDGARALCTEIRAGRFDESFDTLIEAVLARTIADVQVVRPDHLGRGQPMPGQG